MTNNDILRGLRYAFNWKEEQLLDFAKSMEQEFSLEQVNGWLAKDDEEHYKSLHDKKLAILLNGFIAAERGLREGAPLPVAEKSLNNNLILRKLKIALNLKDTDMVTVLDLAKFKFSRHEINAFFRKPEQKQYRECKDQILRNFIRGLQLKYRQ